MNAITVTNLGKAYKQYPNRWARLAEWMLPGKRPRHKLKWVLQDINFTVQPGEAVGIVGINGAGKSTLLKMITGTTQPTTGSVQICGRVAALLELGMGFHPDFTGRQNVLMSGQLMGFSVEQIQSLMSEIEAFAEIGDYVDQPVRVYSSGMQVRLAFSVATCTRPDILIIDEALSVGDSYFQHKCIQRIRQYQDLGTTLIFVSHAPEAVKMLCQKGFMLENGVIVKNGDAASVMDYYRASLVQRTEKITSTIDSDLQEKPSTSVLRESKAVLSRKSVGNISVDLVSDTIPFHSGENISLSIKVIFTESCHDPHIGFGIRTKMGIMIYEANTYTLGHKTYPVSEGEQLHVTFSFPCFLYPDTYEIMIGVSNGGYDIGSFEKNLFFDQSFMVFEVASGKNSGWFGLLDLQPFVNIEKIPMNRNSRMNC